MSDDDLSLQTEQTRDLHLTTTDCSVMQEQSDGSRGLEDKNAQLPQRMHLIRN